MESENQIYEDDFESEESEEESFSNDTFDTNGFFGFGVNDVIDLDYFNY